MDASFALAGLITEFAELLEVRDFEGAEAILERALAETPEHAAFVHLRFGRLYREWNKLTSAHDHVLRASELVGGDPLLRIQVTEELIDIRKKQAAERP